MRAKLRGIDVAVKVLHKPSHLSNEAYQENFEREVDIMRCEVVLNSEFDTKDSRNRTFLTNRLWLPLSENYSTPISFSSWEHAQIRKGY